MGAKTKTDHCLNCCQPLQGENFCPRCGQKNDASKLTVKHFLSEIISNLFAFDGRFYYTLFNLFRYPGKVPDDFIAGKRTRYMHPVRIYFLASILLLFIIQLKSGPALDMVNIDENSPGVETGTLADTLEYTGPTITTSPAGEDPGIFEKIQIMSDYYSAHRETNVSTALDSMNFPVDFYHRFLYKQAIKTADFDDDEFNRYLFSKLFWVFFLFLPISALLLKLLYIRRPFYYPEHLFFTFYTQSAFFILLALSLPWPNGERIAATVSILFGIYLFIAMKRFYKQGFRKTLLKFILLNMLMIPSFVTFFLLSTLVVFILF